MTKQLMKMIFELDTDWHGYSTESIWVEQTSANEFRVRNVPWLANGIAWDDLVGGRPAEGASIFYFTKVIKHSGYSTFRIAHFGSENDREFQKYWFPLEELGCNYEYSKFGKVNLYAIKVPPSAKIDDVYELLDIGVRDGVWEFDEGYRAQITA